MCDKCVEIDEKITHYKELAERILDQTVLERIDVLIAALVAIKEQLHPEQE